MAITAVPTYSTKPKKIGGITVPPVVGYSGSGWAYPSQAFGGKTVTYTPTGIRVPIDQTPYTPGGTNSLLQPPPTSTANPLSVQPAQAAVSRNWQDYLNEAMGTPQWASSVQNYNSLLDSLRTQLKGTANSITSNLGYDIGGQLRADPSLAALAGDLAPDAAAIAAGAANPLSAKAQIDRSYQQGSLDALYSTNARGTLGSGASTAAGNQLLQNSQLQANQAQQDALTSIRNAVSGYTSARDTANQNLMNQQSGIMQALAASAGPVYGVGDLTEEPATSNVPGTNIASPLNVPNQRTRGVLWGGQTFTSVPAITRYLAGQGVSYATWRGNHPAAAAKLEGGY